jgi:hypothetical protein
MPRSPDIAGSQPFASEPALRAPQGGHCPPVLSYRQPQVQGGTRHTTGRKCGGSSRNAVVSARRTQ